MLRLHLSQPSEQFVSSTAWQIKRKLTMPTAMISLAFFLLSFNISLELSDLTISYSPAAERVTPSWTRWNISRSFCAVRFLYSSLGIGQRTANSEYSFYSRQVILFPENNCLFPSSRAFREFLTPFDIVYQKSFFDFVSLPAQTRDDGVFMNLEKMARTRDLEELNTMTCVKYLGAYLTIEEFLYWCKTLFKRFSPGLATHYI